MQHPVMFIINQEAPERGLKLPSALQGPQPLIESSGKNREMLNVACDQTLFRDKDRYLRLFYIMYVGNQRSKTKGALSPHPLSSIKGIVVHDKHIHSLKLLPLKAIYFVFWSTIKSVPQLLLVFSCAGLHGFQIGKGN